MNYHGGGRSQNPDNILRRVDEIVFVGKTSQALQYISEILQKKKNANSPHTNEKVMERFIDLCVESRDSSAAKDGLHQYRNHTSNNQASLQHVIEYLLTKAENKAHLATQACDKKALEAVEDLEAERTSESILLEAITSGLGNDRMEREVLVPWLRFLWESYRSTIEILHSSPRHQEYFHKVVHRAFKFCEEHQRTSEFHKLCEILRKERSSKYDQRKGDGADILDESTDLQLQIETRFEQLRVASQLKLWNESCQTIKSIHDIMVSSTTKISSQLEATYYSKLTELFLVSGNFLFHAYAYKRYYFLSIEKNKSLTKAKAADIAGCVLLSAMSIPLKSGKIRNIGNREEFLSKIREMADMLGFDINLKRDSILQDLLENDIYDAVPEDVKQLFLSLECTKSPVGIVEKAKPILVKMESHADFKNYVPALRMLLINRLLQSLASLYSVVRLNYVEKLLDGLGMPFHDIEMTIIKSIKSRQVELHSTRLDQRNGCIHFGDDIMEEERTRRTLTDLAQGLNTVCKELEPVGIVKLRADNRESRAKTVLLHLAATHNDVLQRKRIIEERKEEYERQEQQRKQLEERKRQDAIKARKDAEALRIEKQMRQREADAQAQLEEERKQFEARQRLIDEGVDISVIKQAGLSYDEQMQLIEETRKKTLEQSLETERKLEESRTRLDATVRALREKEIPKLKALFDVQMEERRGEQEIAWNQTVEESKVQHESNLKLKNELEYLQKAREAFESILLKRWQSEYEAERSARWQECDSRLKYAKLERARKRRQAKVKEINRRKAEEERVEKERQKKAAEAEEKAKQLSQERDKAGTPPTGGSALSQLEARMSSNAFRVRRTDGDMPPSSRQDGGEQRSRTLDDLASGGGSGRGRGGYNKSSRGGFGGGRGSEGMWR